MKKTLFSLAFIAASGVYVAAANHIVPLPDTDEPALAKETVAPVEPASLEPMASATSELLSSEPATHAPSLVVAEADPPATPAPLPLAPLPAPAIVAEAPSPIAPVPLPRPRPAPPAALRQVNSTNVAASTAGGYRDGTYTGASENAYYGNVQVQVVVANHAIAGIKVLNYPSDRRTSRYINSQALPMLQQEVIAADSAEIDTISGATLTSEAYIRSLGTALQQARAAGA